MRTHAVEQAGGGDRHAARTRSTAGIKRAPTRLGRAAVTALIVASVISMLAAASLLRPAKSPSRAPRSVSSEGGGAYADGYFMSISWQARRLDVRLRQPAAAAPGNTRLSPDAFLRAAREVELIGREYNARGFAVTTLLDMDGVVRLSPAGLPDGVRDEISNRLGSTEGVARVELQELNQEEMSKLWDNPGVNPGDAR